MAFLAPVELAPGEQLDLVLEVQPNEPSNGEPMEDEHLRLETPFVRIELDEDLALPVFSHPDVKVVDAIPFSPPLHFSITSLAAYIDQPGLVQQLGSGEIHMARRHQWAEPLRTSLPRFLANGMGVATGQTIALAAGSEDLPRIDVTIDRLGRTFMCSSTSATLKVPGYESC